MAPVQWAAALQVTMLCHLLYEQQALVGILDPYTPSRPSLSCSDTLEKVKSKWIISWTNDCYIFLVHTIFTFYIKDILKFKCPNPSLKVKYLTLLTVLPQQMCSGCPLTVQNRTQWLKLFWLLVYYSPINNLHNWKLSELFITLLVVTVLSTCIIQKPAQQLQMSHRDCAGSLINTAAISQHVVLTFSIWDPVRSN